MTLYSENIKMEQPIIEIAYCTKCRWLTRASWISQELLSTFSSEIGGITLIPSDIAGIFEIRCGRETIWERGKNRGMPEIKKLKQKVRDIIAPDKNLGHIDS
jgi:selenoprotein W-related protein